MNCQDNSRLKVPLPEMCKTTDIGCVPMTSGKPDCPPERDQIPLAYDVDSQTLWIFSCDSRQWVAMSKFQLAELQEVSLDNIRNICELLKIPVYYNPGGGTVQGSMPLADFGKELLKCQDMTPKAAVLPSGLTSFTIEGLESLDPLYVKYVNLEVSGTGSETDPLVVKAQDPLVKWPKKTEEDVDNANQPMLAADLDGEMVRVPYPKKPCEYDRLTQSQVEGASEALIIGCVDESNVKIPYPPQPKDYDPATQDQVDGSNNRWLIAVIDGKQVKIPFPKGVCEFTRKTGEEISAATTDIIACVGGEASQIPLSTLKDNISSGDKWICDLPPATPEELDSSEGFSIAICIGGVMRQMFIDCGSGKKFPSIPVVCGEPVGPPAEGTPPLRVDCDNYLWVWDENAGVWIRVGGSSAPGSDVPEYSSISGDINSKCTDTVIRAYYIDKNAPSSGYKDTKMTPSDLATILGNCGLVPVNNVDPYIVPGSNVPAYSSIAGNINNKCTDTLIRGYYLDKNNPTAGYKNTKMTVSDLAGALDSCGLVSETEMANYFRGGFQGTTYSLCHSAFFGDPGTEWETISYNCAGNSILLKNIQFDDGYATYAMHSQRWLRGTGEDNLPLRSKYGVDPKTGNPIYINYKLSDVKGGLVEITNPFDRPATAQVVCAVMLYSGAVGLPSQYACSVLVGVTTDQYLSDDRFLCGWTKRIVDGVQIYEGCTRSAPSGNMAAISSVQLWNQSMAATNERIYGTSGLQYSPIPTYYSVGAKEELQLFMRMYVTWMAIKSRYYGDTVENPLTGIPSAGFGAQGYLDVTWFPS